ncbi:hypothetical protein [Pseudomonas sp.]|uniref:hypothetical protein n=1 Tax=Pseudomonas sp. TaxID=306 RepID=UPI0027335A99|nr:hypothetical protein [Pseudomonas sp.]MDP3815420.1 hypothetical protein [Pseudomonas sp.]
MPDLTLFVMALVLLAASGLGLWSWRNNARLKRLDQRIRQQSELIEQIDSVLDNPQLSEAEQLAKSEALLTKLRQTQTKQP